MKKEEILHILEQHREEFKQKYKVNEIGIFGSYVKNEAKERRDVDILVEFEEVPDLLTFIELERYLQRLLKKKVDLVRKKGIRPELKDMILKEAVYI